MPHSFRTAVACRIARIDRDRFNEAVAAGNYPCAPRTDRGATRVFDEADLLCLYYYGRLLVWGFPPRLAGHLACLLRDALRVTPDETEIIIRFGNDSILEPAIASSLLSYDDRQEVLRFDGGPYFPVLQRLHIDLEHIRNLVRLEIQRELSVIGPDDEGEVAE